jgi:hypothetical protein
MVKKAAETSAPAASEAELSPRTPIELNTWDDVNQAGLELGLIDLERERLENEREQRKREVDTQYVDALTDLLKRKARYELAIVNFGQAHDADIPGLKKELDYIEVCKSKRVPFVNLIAPIADIVKKLQRSPKWRVLLTTPEPTVSKNDLKKIPEAEHARFGFEIAHSAPIYSVVIKRDRVQLYSKERDQR